mmetsp:Transcript_24492/g.81392  ORF Transcript_24492/g.81392 Transcript_24492/m.81392 type:complete len:312 (-) Transcript_24492:680-1615(-)
MCRLMEASASLPGPPEPPWILVTLYCLSSMGLPMMRRMALKVASTGPAPMAATACSVPVLTSCSRTVAVEETLWPWFSELDCTEHESSSHAFSCTAWSITTPSSDSRSASETTFFASAIAFASSTNCDSLASSSATSLYPSSISRARKAALPECLPSTSMFELSAPTDSGVMISYVAACLSMPCWWMPDSCANAFAPTMALLACTAMPVYVATILDVRMICFVSMSQWTGKRCGRVRSAMTTSSRDVLPARSPSELRVTSTCLAPRATAASEFAVARPRSLWQWVDQMMRSAPLTFAIRCAKSDEYSSGSV